MREPAIARRSFPNTTGTAPPRTGVPANAADCHMHIYDPRFPEPNPRPGRNPQNATVADYRLLQKRLGTTRVVVVQPRNYATDNRVTLDALQQLGANGRGVAVVHPTITDADLESLHTAGIRGIRFSLGNLGGAAAVVTWDMVEPLSQRVAGLGWHVQLNVDGEAIVAHADRLRRLPSHTVFDHLGRPPVAAGTAHPSHAILRELLDKGRTWVKLSGAYSNSTVGPPDYPEATALARAFVTAAPERLVWGSDWPHPTEQDRTLPDDALLLDLLAV